MSSKTTFFSYSRADSAFVLKLAKDLRTAGFNIWLDQLDIKPGSSRDDAIQSALNESKTLIVILSSASVAQENVMDEVSFAMGSKKNLIPVLLKECITPFRLSRFQRVDFTGDYQDGLRNLIEVLNYHAAGKSEAGSPPPGNEPAPANMPETKADEEQWQKEEADNALWQEAVSINLISSYTKYIDESVTGSHAEDALQIINKLVTGQKNKEIDQQLWEETITENTLPAYTQYVNKYPDGNYRQDAYASISKIEATEKKNREIAAENQRALIADQENKLWEEATRVNTLSSYWKYLHETKTGLFKERAQKTIARLDAGQKEKELETQFWKKAKTENTTGSYKSYLQHYGDGIYRKDASAAIKQIEDAEKLMDI